MGDVVAQHQIAQDQRRKTDEDQQPRQRHQFCGPGKIESPLVFVRKPLLVVQHQQDQAGQHQQRQRTKCRLPLGVVQVQEHAARDRPELLVEGGDECRQTDKEGRSRCRPLVEVDNANFGSAGRGHAAGQHIVEDGREDRVTQRFPQHQHARIRIGEISARLEREADGEEHDGQCREGDDQGPEHDPQSGHVVERAAGTGVARQPAREEAVDQAEGNTRAEDDQRDHQQAQRLCGLRDVRPPVAQHQRQPGEQHAYSGDQIDPDIEIEDRPAAVEDAAEELVALHCRHRPGDLFGLHRHHVELRLDALKFVAGRRQVAA